MLSKKTRYALLAMAVLAGEYGKSPVPIGRIAEAERIPQRFLEGILLSLRRIRGCSTAPVARREAII